MVVDLPMGWREGMELLGKAEGSEEAPCLSKRHMFPPSCFYMTLKWNLACQEGVSMGEEGQRDDARGTVH